MEDDNDEIHENARKKAEADGDDPPRKRKRAIDTPSSSSPGAKKARRSPAPQQNFQGLPAETVVDPDLEIINSSAPDLGRSILDNRVQFS